MLWNKQLVEQFECDENNSSDYRVDFFIFGGLSAGMGIPPFEFKRILSNIKANKYFFRDPTQSWYQKELKQKDSQLYKIYHESRKKGNRSIFIGNSMGGFASLMYGAKCRANEIIAFSPQTTISLLHKLQYRDYRWMKNLIKVYMRYGISSENFDVLNEKERLKEIPKINVYYGVDSQLDAIQALRLLEVPTIGLHAIDNTDHNLVKNLKISGQLSLILEGAASKQ